MEMREQDWSDVPAQMGPWEHLHPVAQPARTASRQVLPRPHGAHNAGTAGNSAGRATLTADFHVAHQPRYVSHC